MTFSLQNPPRPRKPVRSLEAAAVLAAARAAQVDVHAAEARKLAAAVEWARLHEVDDPDAAATWGDTPITLAGDGAPLIAHGCVGEFAAVIGTTTTGGRGYLADALELAHRLPQVYEAIQSGRLPAWKGRRIAAETVVLPPDAAADLDARIAPLAGKLSARATQQMIDETIARVLPERAQELADADTFQRVVVDHRQVSFIGTSAVYGALDLADALDLDEALDREAEALRLAGCEASLDARRAMALGRLARGEAATAGRPVTLYVHLPADTTDATALVENGGGPHLLTQAQVARWCGNPDVAVTVKPVIDLHRPLGTGSYEVPDRIKEHVDLRDGSCVFPYCARRARTCQKDHTRPYAAGGRTHTDNLGPLCQHHHNLKTHGRWTYSAIEPGVYLWRSPHGYAFLRDHEGTQDLSPP
ncbi:HNH endonuclease signature motif containing protein [Marmoricola sp. RAF53]|uniref:HNH endonuclease signature motif containing protein n=1 Tax=Marmoricola sp. RAF53 TaxID=3233059 RepID=UPI003F99CF15